jgi:hypothetical protein
MLKSNVFAEILVGYTRLLITVDLFIHYAFEIFAEKLSSRHHCPCPPVHDQCVYGLFAFWAAALIGDKVPKNGEIFGLYICLGHPAMPARPGWLAGWASDMAGWGNGQTKKLPIL